MTNHEPSDGEADRPHQRGSGLFPDPRVFRLGVVTAAVVLASVLAAHLQVALLVPGAFAVAAAADALEPLSIDQEWLGWRRPVDRTRVLLFIGWLALAFVALSLTTYVIDNHIFLCC